MTSRFSARRAAVIAALALVLAAAAVAALPLFRSGPAGPAGPAAPGPAGALEAVEPFTRPAPEPAPTAGAALPPEGVAAAATVVASSSTPAATAPPAPAPFVQTFAAQPGVKPLPAKPSPTAPVKVPANVDGCDRGYGTRTQCVPWTFPSSAGDKCAWLTAQGFQALTVHGSDRHELDLDRNGIACD